MDINLEEVMQEMQRQFPHEFTICVQACQIRKLQEAQVGAATELTLADPDDEG